MALITYICRKCGRPHSYDEFEESRFCRHCGKFLALTDRRSPEGQRGKWQPILGSNSESQSEAGQDPRVKKLLQLGETIDAQELVPVLEEGAAKLIKDCPFAFALAGVLDRGTKAEIIWTIPYYLKKQLGTLDPQFFANASLEDLRKIMNRLPAKPRYLNDAPTTVRALSRMIVDEFDGQAENLWKNRTSRAVKATFERIYGVGPGIASMILLLLERWFGVHFNDIDHRNMDVKPDTHIVRVFHRLGFISEPDSDSAVKAARRLNPEYPGALDSPTWMIGRKWCTAFAPHCKDCPMNKVCYKIVD